MSSLQTTTKWWNPSHIAKDYSDHVNGFARYVSIRHWFEWSEHANEVVAVDRITIRYINGVTLVVWCLDYAVSGRGCTFIVSLDNIRCCSPRWNLCSCRLQLIYIDHWCQTSASCAVTEIVSRSSSVSVLLTVLKGEHKIAMGSNLRSITFGTFRRIYNLSRLINLAPNRASTARVSATGSSNQDCRFPVVTWSSRYPKIMTRSFVADKSNVGLVLLLKERQWFGMSCTVLQLC